MVKGAYVTEHKKSGYKRSTFKTIEFAFAPFVPFSKQFEMGFAEEDSRTDIAAKTGMPGDYAVHARSQPPYGRNNWEDSWEKTFAEYQMFNNNRFAGGRTLDDINNLPRGESEQAAQNMAEEMANLLQGDGPLYPKYDTVQAQEIEERIVVDWMFDENNKWRIQKNPSLWQGLMGQESKWQSEQKTVIPEQDYNLPQAIKFSSTELADIAAEGADQTEKLNIILNQIRKDAGPVGQEVDWDSISQIEVTKAVNSKFTSQIMKGVEAWDSIPDKWAQAGARMESVIINQYNEFVKLSGMEDIFNISQLSPDEMYGMGHEYLAKGKKSFAKAEHRAVGAGTDVISGVLGERYYHPGGGKIPASVRKRLGLSQVESMQYMAKQMINRFAQGIYSTGWPGGGYLWQEPLATTITSTATGKQEGGWVGFMYFRPQFNPEAMAQGSFELTGIDVKTWAIDIVGELPDQLNITREEFLSFLHRASDQSYGTMANYLITSYMKDMNLGKDFLMATANHLGLQVAAQSDFTSQRGEMLGSSISANIDEIAAGHAGDVSIRGIQVLTSTDIAKGIKAQFEHFFDNKTVKDEFEKVYTKAVKESNTLTSLWKRQSAARARQGSMTPSKAQTMFDPMYIGGGSTGLGVGLPWLFYSGRDEQGFSRFGIRSQARLLFSNIRRIKSESERVVTDPTKYDKGDAHEAILGKRVSYMLSPMEQFSRFSSRGLRNFFSRLRK